MKGRWALLACPAALLCRLLALLAAGLPLRVLEYQPIRQYHHGFMLVLPTYLHAETTTAVRARKVSYQYLLPLSLSYPPNTFFFFQQSHQYSLLYSLRLLVSNVAMTTFWVFCSQLKPSNSSNVFSSLNLL
jgi:hypothetical protein